MPLRLHASCRVSFAHGYPVGINTGHRFHGYWIHMPAHVEGGAESPIKLRLKLDYVSKPVLKRLVWLPIGMCKRRGCPAGIPSVRPLTNRLRMPGSSLLKKVQMREAKPDQGGSVHGRTWPHISGAGDKTDGPFSAGRWRGCPAGIPSVQYLFAQRSFQAKSARNNESSSCSGVVLALMCTNSMPIMAAQSRICSAVTS